MANRPLFDRWVTYISFIYCQYFPVGGFQDSFYSITTTKGQFPAAAVNIRYSI